MGRRLVNTLGNCELQTQPHGFVRELVQRHRFVIADRPGDATRLANAPECCDNLELGVTGPQPCPDVPRDEVDRPDQPSCLHVSRTAMYPDTAVARWLETRVPESAVALGAAVALFVLPTGLLRGEQAGQWKRMSTIDWGTILLFGGGLSLGRLMSRGK